MCLRVQRKPLRDLNAPLLFAHGEKKATVYLNNEKMASFQSYSVECIAFKS